MTHVKKAELMMDRPEMGKAHLSGKQCFTHILIEEKLCSCLIDTGASCSIVGKRFLDTMGIKYEDKLLKMSSAKIKSCTSNMTPLGILPVDVIFPHKKESISMCIEFIVMNDYLSSYCIIGNDWLTVFGFDIFNSKKPYFTIGNSHKKSKFPLLNKSELSHITVNELPNTKDKRLEKFVLSELDQTTIYEHLTPKQ